MAALAGLGFFGIDKAVWAPFYGFACPVIIRMLCPWQSFVLILALQVIVGFILYELFYARMPFIAKDLSALGECVRRGWHHFRSRMPLVRNLRPAPQSVSKGGALLFQAWQLSPPLFLQYVDHKRPFEHWFRKMAVLIFAAFVNTLCYFLFFFYLFKVIDRYHIWALVKRLF